MNNYLKLLVGSFQGHLGRVCMEWREQLLRSLAHTEAVIDFGEDEYLDRQVAPDGIRFFALSLVILHTITNLQYFQSLRMSEMQWINYCLTMEGANV